MVLILGLLLGIVGFALLVIGGFKPPGRARIANFSARLAGVLFIAFLPLVFLARILVKHLDVSIDADSLPIIDWSLLALCCVGGVFVLLRAIFKAAPLQRAKAQPPASAPTMAAPEAPREVNDHGDFNAPKQKVRKPGRVDNANPFDFS